MFEAMALEEAAGKGGGGGGGGGSGGGGGGGGSGGGAGAAASGGPSGSGVAVPEIFLCPITTELMRDPVSTVDGLTYERSAIEKWLQTSNTSPLTGAVLESTLLIPCVIVRSQIQDLLERYPELKDE